VVIGVADDPSGRGTRLLTHAYQPARAPILTMNAIDASFAKLGSNLFLATKISFANELAALCEAHGADITQVVGAMALDSRIGGKFLRAGIGFGGSCLPHQVAMTASAGVADGVATPLIQAVDTVNHGQRVRFVERVIDAVGGDLSGRRIALLGLTFKPETDDLRDAPALTIARLLIDRGARVVAYDPMPTARVRAVALVYGLEVADSALSALAGADAAGLVTEWSEFGTIDWRHAASVMHSPTMIDGRNFLEPTLLAAAGFRYVGFGRRVDTAPPRSTADVPVVVGGEEIPIPISVESPANLPVG
jgi:UDPglucose 6-dehydrogenase